MPTATRNNADVFLNVPYDKDYEPILVGLTAALVALGRNPRLTFGVPDCGEGRLRKMVTLIRDCPVSFHDLSSVALPPRFNMPFELGLACAIRELGRGPRKHKFFILEEADHRIDVHLSDVKGIDPKIHNGTAAGAISAVLEVLDKPGYNATAAEVKILCDEMQAAVPAILLEQNQSKLVDSMRAYGTLVGLGWQKAADKGFHTIT